MNLPVSIHIVNGHSMQPTILNGSHVVVFRWAYTVSQPKVGDIVVFSSNGKEYVKRISAVQNDEFNVEGDNKADSLRLPPIPGKVILGKVVAKY